MIEGAGEAAYVAYFSMEIALEPSIPTYSGGLGILAGDTLRAAADRGLRMLGVTLAHRYGYFRQRLDTAGSQSEHEDEWDPATRGLDRLPFEASVEIEGRNVRIAAWQYAIAGEGGAIVPVLLLDTDLPENDPWDRRLTHYLYGGDSRYRLAQEIVLGLGGAAMLRAHGIDERIGVYHMNEGHTALVVGALLERYGDIAEVRARCVFTTHTPVPAG